jgi:putative transcriptional regulator
MLNTPWLRPTLPLNQAGLAAVLNTSPSTVLKWEMGNKRPRTPLKLLNQSGHKGLEALG